MLTRLNDILRKHNVATDPQEWAAAHGVDVMHVDKRGNTASCYIMPDQEQVVIDLIAKEVLSAEEKKRSNGHRVEPLGVPYRFVPTQNMIDRLASIEAKMDLILQAFDIKKAA